MYQLLKMTLVIALSMFSYDVSADRELSDKEWVATVYEKDIASTALFSFTPKDNPDGWVDIGIEFDKFKVGGKCRGFFYIFSHIPNAPNKLLNLTDKQISEMKNGFKNATLIIDGVELAPMSEIFLDIEVLGDTTVEMTIRYFVPVDLIQAMVDGELLVLSLTTDNVLKVTLAGSKKTIKYASQICKS